MSDTNEEDTFVVTEPTKPYEYFDTPNGEDIGKKLWCVFKPTAMVAFGVSTIDVMMYSKPKKYLAILSRYAYVAFPFLTVAATFVITTNLLKNYRNKEDYMNWALGGLMSGGVLGAYKGKATAGWNYGIIFALVAMGKKYAVDNNVTLIPERNVAYGTIRFVRHDYTLSTYRPGNYTVGPIGSVGPVEPIGSVVESEE